MIPTELNLTLRSEDTNVSNETNENTIKPKIVLRYKKKTLNTPVAVRNAALCSRDESKQYQDSRQTNVNDRNVNVMFGIPIKQR